MWALLALLLGQVALADHSATHVDHDFQQEASSISHGDHNHDEDHKAHECPKCVLTQSLQAAFYDASAILPLASQAEIITPLQQPVMVSIHQYNAHPARAPPAILI